MRNLGLSTNLVKNFDKERVDARRYEAMKNFVPTRILCSIVVGIGLIDVMSDTQSNVGIHSCHSVILHQASLHESKMLISFHTISVTGGQQKSRSDCARAGGVRFDNKSRTLEVNFYYNSKNRLRWNTKSLFFSRDVTSLFHIMRNVSIIR